MSTLKNLGKQLLRILIYFLIYSLVLTIFYHFNIIDQKITSYLRFIGFIIILFFNSNNLSRKINKNDVLNGLILGGSIILIFIILTLILGYKINIKSLIYYLLILGVSILGSSRKKKKKNLKY